MPAHREGMKVVLRRKRAFPGSAGILPARAEGP